METTNVSSTTSLVVVAINLGMEMTRASAAALFATDSVVVATVPTSDGESNTYTTQSKEHRKYKHNYKQYTKYCLQDSSILY